MNWQNLYQKKVYENRELKNAVESYWKGESLEEELLNEAKTIRQGQFTKFRCKNGAMVMVNDSNILMIEVFQEDKDE